MSAIFSQLFFFLPIPSLLSLHQPPYAPTRSTNPPFLLPTVLGALSKSLATLATQPLIVAKVGLQSRPPPSRNGKPFKTFGEVMAFIIHHEGVLALFKGIGPQITKGLLVQGVLMMVKERYVPVHFFTFPCYLHLSLSLFFPSVATSGARFLFQRHPYAVLFSF